ncbi:MAG: [Fe-Fe] hydrogenase large subunit C-terminal domain-containing protein, partial [Angelakisella sp.]
FPAAIQYLADVVSPMLAHSADIKRRYPTAKTVFIGPCIAKKDEAEHSGGLVDAALTFDELTNWLEAQSIALTPEHDHEIHSKARLFPTSGGILRTMDCTATGYDYLVVDGVENCIAALNDIAEGNLSRCFIEMSACVGSCINGPVIAKHRRAPIRASQQVNAYAGKEDFAVQQLPPASIRKAYTYLGLNHKVPSEYELTEILSQMGKTRPEQELNCGSCGYNTCREKAVAIYQGKAEVSMCLPFLKEKAESFSDNILYNTPNGIFVLNENLEVQQINRAARKMMNIRNSIDVLGEPVVRILDPQIFFDARQGRNEVREQRSFLAEYGRYVEQTVIYDRDYRIFVCIMRDVTEEERQRSQREEFSRRTIDIADRVVEKQMRVVQEIASLLGETTAETKIALTKLKESISDE